MKLTKATLNRINKHGDLIGAEYITAVGLIGEILNRAGVLLGESGHYTINDGDDLVTPIIHSDGKREFVSGTVNGDYYKRVMRGLYTRYPTWLSCTFTLGNNGVDLYEVNKLVRAIVES